MAGKLVRQAAVAASAAPGDSSRLCYLADQLTNQKFLVDTGAAYSVIPFSSKEPPHGPAICTADKSPIPCWGVAEKVISAGGQSFEWSFLKAKVAFPILGADFLQHFDLWVDLWWQRLVRCGGKPLQLNIISSVCVSSGIVSAELDTSSSSSSSVEALETVEALENVEALTAAVTRGVPPPVIAAQSGSNLQQQLETEFPTVFNPSKLLPPVSHSVQHHMLHTAQQEKRTIYFC